MKRVALLGAISRNKGSELIQATVQAARLQELPLDFVVIGYTDRDEALKQEGVEITGRYPREKAAQLLASSNPDFVWFSSVWPETYCYTLSAAFEAGIYPVAFDMGAIATRIRMAGWGRVLPLDLMLEPLALAQTLADITVPANVPHKLIIPTNDSNFIESYYGLKSVFQRKELIQCRSA